MIKLALSLAAVAVGYYKADFTAPNQTAANEIAKSLVMALPATICNELFTRGFDKTMERIVANSVNGGDAVNHHLQKAAEKAQIIATLMAVRHCRRELDDYPSRIKKAVLRLKHLVSEDQDRASLDFKAKELIKRYRQIDSDPAYQSRIKPLDYAAVKTLADKVKLETASAQISALVFDIKLNAIEQFPATGRVNERLAQAIREGWDEPVPGRFGAKRHFDWFALVCGFFDEQYKTDKGVEAALNKLLLFEIRGQQISLGEAGAKEFERHSRAVMDALNEIKLSLAGIENKQDEILAFVGDILGEFAKLSEQIGKVQKRVDTLVGEAGEIKTGVANVATGIGDLRAGLGGVTGQLKLLTAEQGAANRQAAIAEARREEIERRKRQAAEAPGTLVGGLVYARSPKFFDRVKEYAELRQLLLESAAKIVVVKAAGGYGKTALADELLKRDVLAAHRRIVNPQVREVVVFNCQFNEGNLETVVARADEMLKRAEREGESSLQKFFAQQIADEQKILHLFARLRTLGAVWFVFDNFESVMEQDNGVKDARMAKFLALAARSEHDLRVLLTAREIPHFDGSQDVRLIELREALPLDDAYSYIRSLQAEHDIKWRVADAAAEERCLKDLCAQLNCIPKAIYSFAEYWRKAHERPLRLDKFVAESALLAGFKQHDAETGYRKLVGEQFAVLSAAEQAAWRALSVFRQAVPEAALRYVLADLALDWDTLRSLLRDSGLIIVDEVDERFEYSLEQTAGEYIYETQLTADAVQAQASDFFNRRALHLRAAGYYASVKERDESRWHSLTDVAAQLEEIHQRMTAADYERANDVVHEIEPKIKRMGNARLLVKLHEALASKLLSPPSIAMNMKNLGNAYSDLGDKRKAIEYYTDALAIHREVSDRVGEAKTLGNLGATHADLGDKRKAIEYHTDALAIHREVGGRVGEAITLGNLGATYADLGDKRKAIEYHTDALAIHREVGDRVSEGITLGNLGATYADLGDKHKAIEYHTDALAIHREVGNRVSEGITLGNLGNTYSDLGDKRKAIEYHTDALAIHREVGNRVSEGITLGNYGLAKIDVGEQTAGIALIEQALQIARQVEDKMYEEIWLKELERLKPE